MKPTVGHGPFTVDGMVAKRQPLASQLAREQIDQDQLSRSSRHIGGRVVGASIDGDVFQEAVEKRHGSDSSVASRCESAR